MMRRGYVTPKVTCEAFAPNEYIAACAQSQGIGFVICDGSSHSNKTISHGFIIDSEDYRKIVQYDPKRRTQFEIYKCSVPGCPEGKQEDSSLDLDGDSIWKDEDAKDPDGYKWFHITFMSAPDDEARFTVDLAGSGGSGGLDYTAS